MDEDPAVLNTWVGFKDSRGSKSRRDCTIKVNEATRERPDIAKENDVIHPRRLKNIKEMIIHKFIYKSISCILSI